MANSAKRQRRPWNEYAFPGFRPLPTVRGVFGDAKARVITVPVANFIRLASDGEMGDVAVRCGTYGRLIWRAFVGQFRSRGAPALLSKLGDSRMRRQIERWIGREYRAATPPILETLRAALDDHDWEVRASAMLIAARLRTVLLRSAVNNTTLPSAHQHGLDERDALLLLAARQIATAALDASNEDDAAGAIKRTLLDVSLDLVKLTQE